MTAELLHQIYIVFYLYREYSLFLILKRTYFAKIARRNPTPLTKIRFNEKQADQKRIIGPIKAKFVAPFSGLRYRLQLRL